MQGKRIFAIIVAAIALLLSACAANSADCSGLPAGGPKIKIESAWMRTAVTSTSAAYLTLTNCSTEPEILRGAESDAGMASLHLSEMRDGVAVMNEVKGIDLPVGKKVELKPNSYHIMLMNLKREIKAGDPVKLTLIFEKAGRIGITAAAKNP